MSRNCLGACDPEAILGKQSRPYFFPLSLRKKVKFWQPPGKKYRGGLAAAKFLCSLTDGTSRHDLEIFSDQGFESRPVFVNRGKEIKTSFFKCCESRIEFVVENYAFKISP